MILKRFLGIHTIWYNLRTFAFKSIYVAHDLLLNKLKVLDKSFAI